MVVCKKKERVTTEVNRERERAKNRLEIFRFVALRGLSGSLPVNDGSIVVSDNFYNKAVKRLLSFSPFLFVGFYFSPPSLFFFITRQTSYWLFRFRFVMNKDHIEVNSAVYGDDSCCSSGEVKKFLIFLYPLLTAGKVWSLTKIPFSPRDATNCNEALEASRCFARSLLSLSIYLVQLRL